ncbi:hypothetical protein [Streptomyces sp. NRRL F-5123]|uniref:hypothetical protein n=1 Tax=Streptomyces sp. NRRL F-5123 TaxID=1463856 RepID=UPI0004E18D9F|nr:hypothetical protein [Streptomyces sp. NRRL F-5123]
MEVFLGEVGKKLTDRWLTRIVLPGVLFAAALALAAAPGRAGSFDVTAAVRWLDRLRADRYATPAGRIAALVAGLLVVTAPALVADRLSRVVVRTWRLPAMKVAGPLRDVEQRVRAQHGVSMALVWPRLWQLAPDSARQDVQAAWTGYSGAALRTAWAVPYAVAGAWLLWWPGPVVAAALLASGWRAGLRGAGVLGETIEATVDTGLNGLAAALGVRLPHGRVRPDEGTEIDELLNKGRRP